MVGFVLKPEVSIGDLLTIISIVISIIALLVAWSKDRELKRTEYADKIRQAAALVTAKLERWRELSLCFFDDIQPLITEADVALVKGQGVVNVRDSFWHELAHIRTTLLQRIIDEQIQIAYADLYGYDPRIRVLFSEAIRRLKLIDQSVYEQTLYLTQADVLGLQSAPQPFNSAQLGNALRNTCYYLAITCDRLFGESIAPFNKEMLKLIEAKDHQIVERNVKILSVDKVYTSDIGKLLEALEKEGRDRLAKASVDLEQEAFTAVQQKQPGQTIGLLVVDHFQEVQISEEAKRQTQRFADQVVASIASSSQQERLRTLEPKRSLMSAGPRDANQRTFRPRRLSSPVGQSNVSKPKKKKKKR
jgi:hypothetical protein